LHAQAEHEAQAGEKPWADSNFSTYLVVVTVSFPFHACSFCPSKVDSNWKIHIVWNSMTVFFWTQIIKLTEAPPSLVIC